MCAHLKPVDVDEIIALGNHGHLAQLQRLVFRLTGPAIITHRALVWLLFALPKLNDILLPYGTHASQGEMCLKWFSKTPSERAASRLLGTDSPEFLAALASERELAQKLQCDLDDLEFEGRTEDDDEQALIDVMEREFEGDGETDE